MSSDTPSTKLGIIAGGGELPERIITACLGMGRGVFVVAVEGEANSPSLKNVPHKTCHLGAVGKAISAFKAEGVTDVVFAGKVKRPSFSSLKLDMDGVKLMARIMKSRIKGDNTVLSTVMQYLEEQGFNPVGADSILEDIVATEGGIGILEPQDEAIWDDIKLGVKVIQTLGKLDIGQGVITQQGVVLGIEAIEGTDNLLMRVGEFRLEGRGGVLVKLKKPGQEARVDLPTIGVTTIENAHKAGLKGVAIEANGALIINREAVASKADELGLFVVGIYPDELDEIGK